MYYRYLIMGVATLISPFVMAQEASESSDDTELRQETITITARKIDETLLEAPIGVSAFDQDTIESLQLHTIDDIARFTPGLSFSKAFGRNTERPVVRGQSNVLAGVQFGVESGTAYFVDGVYYAGSIQNIDANELERVEVVKGPQAALYGRNTYAGAINFITRGGSDELERVVKTRLGNNGTGEVNLFISGPLSDTLTSSVSVRYYKYGGEWTNQVTNQTVGDESTTSISTVFDWAPNDRFNARARLSLNKDDDGVLPLFLQGADKNNCAPGHRSLYSIDWANTPPAGTRAKPFTNKNQYYCGVVAPGQVAVNTGADADNVANKIPSALDNTIRHATTQAEKNIYELTDGTAFDGLERNQTLLSLVTDYVMTEEIDLQFLFGYRKEKLKTGYDSDHSPVNFKHDPRSDEPVFANTERDDVEDLSIELKLSSALDNKLRWSAGVYAYNQEVNEFDLTFEDPSGASKPLGDRKIENRAIFGFIEYDYSEQMSISFEARFAQETKSDTRSPIKEIKFEAFSPKVTIDYDLENGGTLYGIISRGAKPGGLNGAGGAGVGHPTYEQEESDNLEVGVKTPLADSGFNLTAAWFFTKAKDVQLTTPFQNARGAVTSIATNQGSGEITGLELDVRGFFDDNWSGGATFAWTNPEFTEGCDGDEWTITSGGGTNNPRVADDERDFTSSFSGSGPATCSIVGNQFPLSSKNQASAFVRYDGNSSGPMGSRWFAVGNVTFESSKFAQVHNRAKTGAATELGVRAGLRNDQWSFSVYGQNLTDEDSVTMVTRWLQNPYVVCLPFPPFACQLRRTVPANASTSGPRAFFGSLRRGQQFGVEFKYNF